MKVHPTAQDEPVATDIEASQLTATSGAGQACVARASVDMGLRRLGMSVLFPVSPAVAGGLQLVS